MAKMRDMNASYHLDNTKNLAFLLSLEIYGKNLHNCLIDSDASRNVIPYSIWQKLGLKLARTNNKIIQLDKIEVNVIGKLKNVYVQLSANPRIYRYIDIQAADILGLRDVPK